MSSPRFLPYLSALALVLLTVAGRTSPLQHKVLAAATPLSSVDEGLGGKRATAPVTPLPALERRPWDTSRAKKVDLSDFRPRAPIPKALDLLAFGRPELFRMLQRGLDREDPALALAAARALLLDEELPADGVFRARLGLGKAWLLLGQARTCEAYAQQLIQQQPRSPKAWALFIRAGLRSGDFSGALLRSREAVRKLGLSDLDLRSAHASALFRNGDLRAALDHYKAILAKDPKNIEALIRLGTGLLPHAEAAPSPELDRSLGFLQHKDYEGALDQVLSLLERQPMHPVALRMAGELQLAWNREKSPLVAEGALGDLWTLLGHRGHLVLDLTSFYPDLLSLDGPRRQVLTLSSIPFQRGLARVALHGGSHDILMEKERTTDARSRRWLKGKRTFDGRSWDDVRGIGGLSAATGIEALDEAHGGGFQTLVHELAHQVHHFSLRPEQKNEIRELYQAADRGDLFLDYYAASNEAEYFAQGVEAYFSYLKSAGQPLTHGHTHFELLRRDPRLAAFIARIVEWDPLAGPERQAVLARSFRAALRVGRVEDAATILDLVPGQGSHRELREEVQKARNRYRTL